MLCILCVEGVGGAAVLLESMRALLTSQVDISTNCIAATHRFLPNRHI
jgi:hypothetical protein